CAPSASHTRPPGGSCGRRLRIMPSSQKQTVAARLQSGRARSILPGAGNTVGTRECRRLGMPKRKQRQGTGTPTQPPSGPGFEAWRMRIESLIASGKSRDAVEAAKQYLKHAPSPDAEALVVLLCCRYCQALFTPFFFPLFFL